MAAPRPDQSVIEAIRAIRAAGKEVMFYPFILMDQLAGNTLPDPWTGGLWASRRLPWRGRITLSQAPGRAGSPDRTAAAAAEVAAFFGTAQPADFTRVRRSGDLFRPGAEWGYRRFILHYAHLCAVAGGVDAFCIGSEMRGLTQIRGAGDSFPAVAALRQLAAEVRAILGPATKISYAADWSEYFGYHDRDGNVYFHLDPLWADANIDFIGIDNYMPLSDWRDGEDHADAGWGSIYNLGLSEGEHRRRRGLRLVLRLAPKASRCRSGGRSRMAPMASPGSFAPRISGTGGRSRITTASAACGSAQPTAWVPRSKPIWFTELGCAAIDKGDEPAERVPRSEVVGIGAAAVLERPAR